MASELLQQGVELFRAGDREGAYRVLRQAVQENPQDARAWYYLAGVASDVEERREYLERVLEIMPENEKAREQLSKLPPKSVSDEFDDLDFGTTTGQSASSVQASAVSVNTIEAPSDGFSLPIKIPGAPEKVSPDYLIKLFSQQFQNGIAILRKEPGVYPQEIQRSSWWLFWAYIAINYILIALATTITSAIANARLAAAFRELEATFGTVGVAYTPPNIFNILLTFLFTIPISVGALYAGLRVSHGWLKGRGGQASLVTHAYTIALPVVTASIISNLISLVLTIIPFLGSISWLVSLGLWVYSLFVAVEGIQMIHKVEPKTGWQTIGVMFIVQLIVGIILGLILSPFILSSGFAGFL